MTSPLQIPMAFRNLGGPPQRLSMLVLVAWLMTPYHNVTDPLPAPKPVPGPTDPVPRPPDPRPEPPLPEPTPPSPNPLPAP